MSRIGTWSHEADGAVLHLSQPWDSGAFWGVRAHRDGTWRIFQAPVAYQDDERRYPEGNVITGHEDAFANSKEVYAAAKKAARKYLVNLLRVLDNERMAKYALGEERGHHGRY